MKIMTAVPAALALLFVAACEDRDQTSVEINLDPADSQAERALRDAGDAIEDAADEVGDAIDDARN